MSTKRRHITFREEDQVTMQQYFMYLGVIIILLCTVPPISLNSFFYFCSGKWGSAWWYHATSDGRCQPGSDRWHGGEYNRRYECYYLTIGQPLQLSQNLVPLLFVNLNFHFSVTNVWTFELIILLHPKTNDRLQPDCRAAVHMLIAMD